MASYSNTKRYYGHRIKKLMFEAACSYHCGTHHPIVEMHQVLIKNSKRWRCITSIEATKVEISKRDAFGKRISAINGYQ